MKTFRPALPPLKTLSALLAACFAVNAQALPTAPMVSNGSASFQQNGNTLTVTNSNGAIINWNSFSIGAGETTHFIQSTASSSVLNRVVGVDPSRIYGTLSSNGRIYLVNPNGVFVGPGGRVDAAGFIASTLALADQDFLAGRLAFTRVDNAGAVENQGTITTPEGGNVYLIGSQVSNSGSISAPGGEVILAAGQAVQLVNTGTPGVTVEFSASDHNVQNFGVIAASGGQIGLAAALVKNSGTLNASSVSREGGRIFLRASKQVEVDAAGRIVANGTRGGTVQLKSDDTTLVSGTIETRGSTDQGGRVEVLGNKVAVFDGAVVDASGQTNGGTILVGGDLQGKNPELPNAAVTWFGAGARLNANAGARGNGGKVIVWADDTTRAFGQISARGGAVGGNGGFAEVSGKRYLDFHSPVDLGVTSGAAGTLLLDPMDVDIVFGTIPNPPTFYGDAQWFESANAAASTTLSWTNYLGNPGIKDLLDAGTNVVITTAGANGSPIGGGSITMFYGGGTPYTWTSAASLKLLAHNNISIGDGVIGSLGTLEMIASWDGNLTTPGVLAAGTGTISEQTDGYVIANSVKAFAGGSVTLGHLQNRIGNLKAYSDTGNILYNGGASTGPNDIYLVDLRAPNGSITVNTNNTFGGNVTLGFLQASTSTGTVDVTARQAILEDDPNTTDIVAFHTNLVSAYGANSPSTLAISADVNNVASGTQVDIVATVNAGTATYGGIRLVNTNTASFDLTGKVQTDDNSTFGGNTLYLGKGDLDLGSGSRHNFNTSSGLGSLTVGTPGHLYISSTVDTFENVSLLAGGDIETGIVGVVNATKVASLKAGNLIWIDGPGQINGNTGVGFSAPSVLVQGHVSSSAGAVSIAANTVTLDGSFGAGAGAVAGEKGVSIVATSDILLNNGASITTGSNLSLNGDIALLSGGDVVLDNASLITNAKSAAPLANIAISATGKLKLNNGSRIFASDDVLIELTGGNSAVMLNEFSGMPNPSYIVSDVASGLVGTTYIDFRGVTSGGVIINGVATTTSAAGDSGFFNLSNTQPAILGTGLKITYAAGVDPVAKELGSIFDNNTRDTENVTNLKTEDVKKLADEIADGNKSESDGEDAGSNNEGNKDGAGKSKPSQCT